MSTKDDIFEPVTFKDTEASSSFQWQTTDDSGFGFIKRFLANRKELMVDRLEQDFRDCVERVRKGEVTIRPTQTEKLRLYGLYKQATEGDVKGAAPDPTDFVVRAKFMAWEKCKGMEREEAMRGYIDAVGQ